MWILVFFCGEVLFGMFLEKLDEGTVFEVLVATGCDDSFNVKPFGMMLVGGNVVLNLYPNRTLVNICEEGCFTVHFTADALLFTEGFFGLLCEDSLGLVDCSVVCDVVAFSSRIVDDNGKNIITTITAKPVKIIENNRTTTIINRSTNKIIELLVSISRFEYMDIDAMNKFYEKLESTDKYIQKNGNKKHKKAIKIIKKRVNPHD